LSSHKAALPAAPRRQIDYTE